MFHIDVQGLPDWSDEIHWLAVKVAKEGQMPHLDQPEASHTTVNAATRSKVGSTKHQARALGAALAITQKLQEGDLPK